MEQELLTDLLRHQAWADAEHWRALRAHPQALADRAILERLNHIHLTQKAFLTIVQRQPLDLALFAAEPDARKLVGKFRALHEEALKLVRGFLGTTVNETVIIPWFTTPQLALTVDQALAQAAMHSQYHRGQNASRFRELGGEPPLTDLIAWYWKGKPDPAWPPDA